MSRPLLSCRHPGSLAPTGQLPLVTKTHSGSLFSESPRTGSQKSTMVAHCHCKTPAPQRHLCLVKCFRDLTWGTHAREWVCLGILNWISGTTLVGGSQRSGPILLQGRGRSIAHLLTSLPANGWAEGGFMMPPPSPKNAGFTINSGGRI